MLKLILSTVIFLSESERTLHLINDRTLNLGGETHQGIRRDVQSYLLHRHHGTRPAVGSGCGDFHRRLLVHGPFQISPFVGDARRGLENLGGRRAGISGDQIHAGGQGTERDGSVAHHILSSHFLNSCGGNLLQKRPAPGFRSRGRWSVSARRPYSITSFGSFQRFGAPNGKLLEGSKISKKMEQRNRGLLHV